LSNSLSIFLTSTVEDRLRRLNSRLRGSGRSLELTHETTEDFFYTYLRLRTRDENATLIIPRTHKNQYGNLVIGEQTSRVVCPFMLVSSGQPQHASYDELISTFLSCNVEEFFPEQGKRNHIDKILWGFANKLGRQAVHDAQRFLNQAIFNALPLSGTPLQDWAMNHRLMIFDPVFETLRPEEKLAYQKRKNELLFPWTSIGLSDGAAAVKNYILQTELREITAFGIRHHNPMRNLYSTLGMKGEETPLVISQSAKKLEDQGITRGGWNWMTVFLDLPLNFEDQILVSRRHSGKQIKCERNFIIFGSEDVNVGATIKKGKVLGLNEDESSVVFDIDCDHAKVIGCKDSSVPFDGLDQPVRIITLEIHYSFKEGFKLTNQHGNKGVVILEDLGTVHDPVRGEIPIDIIVSAKSIQKRKNFGQVLEALATLICGPTKRQILPDDIEVREEEVVTALKKAGYADDGTCQVDTPWGTFNSICGWVHWGVTKTPEEQLWEGKDTWQTDQRGLRIRGNKVSPIEIKALTTLLGPGSKTVKEILNEQQGSEEVQELLWVIDGLRGNYLSSLPVVNPETFCYKPAGLGTFHSEAELAGSLADETMYPNGCYIQLPITLRIEIPLNRWKGEIVEGISGEENSYAQEARVFETDRLMVPSFALRQPWKHPTGKLGLSDICTMLNQIIESCDRLKHGEIKPIQVSRVVYRYLRHVSRSLSTKSGKISQLLMSVRYPWSSKATAVLGRSLPKNWVEIHKDMARDLKIETGDYVLVERFPCLGFMSTRIQRVRVTDDPECKYVIRVSGNSLVSMNLDFDGDVIYIMSFHSDGAKKELRENFHNPHPRVKEVIDKLNNRKLPITRPMSLQELELTNFQSLSPEEHAKKSSQLLSVKLYTGPVIALCYNLMRIAEANFSYHDREAHINIEMLLDKVGNSVFSQKHGTKSLREECVEAVCLADSRALIGLGFPEKETQQLCNVIRCYAEKMGIKTNEQLKEHYKRHVTEGRSNIINAIVRRFHRTYFATRSNLHPIDMLECLEDAPKDLVSFLIAKNLSKNQNCQQLQVNA